MPSDLRSELSPSQMENGWAFDSCKGACYHFEHFPVSKARKKQEAAEEIHVVETVNWTFGCGDEKTVHHNKYFSFTLCSALALAFHIGISEKDVAETVVAIRKAKPAEEGLFLAVEEYFHSQMPEAISEEKAMALVHAVYQASHGQ